jgi:flagellar basal-body rod protein FlgB
MDPMGIGLFDLAEKRLAWNARRQGVLASNIANANTPGYRARDVQSFAATLAGMNGVEPARTHPSHMAGTVQPGLASVINDPAASKSLDGNSVALDKELTKVADSATTQSLVTTIWKKYVGMFNIALGRTS